LSKKAPVFTKIAQEMTKNARFLQIFTKKLQKIHVFLPQMRPKSTTLRQIRNPKFTRRGLVAAKPAKPCGGQTPIKPKTKPFLPPKTNPKTKTNPIQTQFTENPNEHNPLHSKKIQKL
jgi:hypothetical protein